MKRNTGKIALCGVLSALSVAIMLFSYFPSMTYAVPAIAGLVFILLVVDGLWRDLGSGASARRAGGQADVRRLLRLLPDSQGHY